MAVSERQAPAFVERRQDRDLGTGRPTGVRAFADQLLAAAMITREDLSRAIEQAEHQKLPLHDVVVSMGLVAESDSYAVLSKVTGTPLLDLNDVRVSELAVRLVPEKLARRHTVLPLHEDNRTITFAVVRPLDIDIERDIGFAAGRTPRALLAQRSQVLEGLDRYYPKMGEVERLLDRLKSEARVESPESANS